MDWWCGCLKPFLQFFERGRSTFVPSTIQVGDMHLVALSTIGEGAYSKVLKCRDPFTDTLYAVKTMNVGTLDAQKNADREITILKSVRDHRNVVHMYDAGKSTSGTPSATTSPVAYIATEYCEGSLIHEMMEAKATKHFLPLETHVLRAVSDMVHALAYLHSRPQPISHRDLKPENILCQDGIYKLCDFGSATTQRYECSTAAQIALAEEEFSKVYTLQYRAPETLDLWKKHPVDERVDVWALGVMTYYLCFLTMPFEESSLSILQGRYTFPPYTTNCTRELEGLIRKMLVVDPRDRPTIFAVSHMLHEIYRSHEVIPPPSSDRSPTVVSSSSLRSPRSRNLLMAPT